MMDTTSQNTYAAQLVKLFPPQGEWTEEDYLALPDSNQIIELTDGVLVMPPPPTYGHQNAVVELMFVLKRYVDSHNLGTVTVAPLAVRLWEGKIREPDVMFYRKEHHDRIGEQYSGPPDWVAEIISPGTRKTDQVEKLAEYAQAGIPEYWLVDVEGKTIRVHVLRGEAAYTLAATYRAEDVARSETIEGFEVAVDRMVTA